MSLVYRTLTGQSRYVTLVDYELFQQGPEVYIPILLTSVLVTLVAYGAFPFIFARARTKAITKKKFYLLCFGVNFLVMILFKLIGGSTSAAPYVLWTWIFARNGMKNLEGRGKRLYPEKKPKESKPAENAPAVRNMPAMPRVEEKPRNDATSEAALRSIMAFQANETTRAMAANIKEQPNHEQDADFGLVPQKPIFTLVLMSVQGERDYLAKLYTANGEKITYTRRGSTSAAGVNGMIDIYDTYLPSGQFYKTIYINMYGARQSQVAPKGFSFYANANHSKALPHATARPKKKLYCVQCGVELPADSAFCNKCGAKIEAAPIHNEPPIYIDSLFSVNQEHVGKYVQLIGMYSWTSQKKEPLKCNIIQYSRRRDMSVAVELTEPLPDYVVNKPVLNRQPLQPIILRGVLEERTTPYHEFVLKYAEYEGYWRDETGKIRCLNDSCGHECSKDCPIYLNKLGKQKYDEYNRDEAIDLFKRAVFLTPDFAEAWRNLGYAYLDSQQYNDAYEAFCEANMYDRPNERTMYGEIVSLSKVGRHKEAQDFLDKYKMLFPDKDSGTLSNIIRENLSKAQEKPRITDDEYVALLAEKGFDEFWKALVEEKERSFSTKTCRYTGDTYRKRCEHLEWLARLDVGNHCEKLFCYRKALVDDEVSDANSMLLFDAIDEYERRYVRY